MKSIDSIDWGGLVRELADCIMFDMQMYVSMYANINIYIYIYLHLYTYMLFHIYIYLMYKIIYYMYFCL